MTDRDARQDARRDAQLRAVQAARRLEDFTRVACEWFWETDAESRIVFLSERYFHDTGEAPQAMLGRFPWDIGFVIEDAEAQRQVIDAVRQRRELPSCVVLRTFADGERRYFQVVGGPHYLPDGSFAGFRGTAHDVSELARLAEIADAARRELEAEIAERQTLERRLREMAMTDALTGATNRRAFLEVATRELARAARHRRPLALVAIDIDHFKPINDGHGHAGGDAVLCAIARLCLEEMRAADTFGRLGGEEFAVLLPETALDAALRTAERLRATIAALAVPFDGKDIVVTASFGVATLQPSDRDVASLMRRADAALYQAKHSGRNCVAADAPAGPRIVAG